ncbi:MAG: cob(I)yrinic acid a,c-diamide adenosyltransferase [Actinomycetota bacterium]|nr:cob(I)yrinic acid a,c-diamide adenosyltransferase [Actinomycetota bacterium]
MPRIYTKKGDDGTTGLLYGGRVAKDDLRTQVYGTLDETVSALGVARAGGLVPRVEEIVIRLQREMFIAGAELATSEENRSKLQPGISKVDGSMTAQAEADIDALLEEHPLRPEFVLPGETLGAAGIDLARSTVRRAERQAVALDRQGALGDPEVLRYLNRVSDLLFALARYEEAERGKAAPPSRRT